MRKIKFLLSTLVLLMVAALPVNASWTVAGSSAALNGTSDWAAGNIDNDMTSGDDTNFTLVVTDCTLELGTNYSFKVVKDHAWDESYPGSDYVFTVPETAVYTVEYSFNADSKDVGVNFTKTGEAGVIVHTFTVAGEPDLMGNGWAVDDTNNDMITNDDTNYTLTLSNRYLATGTYEYKVVQDHSWGVSFPPSNAQLVVSHNGYYNVVFTFNANSKAVNATANPVPYVVDFNTAITTSDHAFQVASNWRHIVGSYTDYWDNTSYPSYSYSTTAGVDGGGALSCGTNQSSNGIYDLLVTPVVKGTVTIAAKQTASYYTPLLEFYKIIDNGDGTYSRGDKIDVDVSALNATDYVTITIPVAEAGERIGIRSSYVWLDNFTAEEAIVAPEPKITIASATPSATTGTIYWEQQANGKVLVSYTVTVTNTGEVDLTSGAEGFSVSIINGSTGDVYSTVAVPQDLAVGETSDEFVVSAEVETSIWPNSYTYIQMNLKENLFGQVVERAQSHYKAYEPKLVFRKAGSTSTSSISSAEAWGTITESTTENYEIFNNGTAPLVINSIVIPEGFKGSPSVLERADEYNASGAVWYAWTWNDGEEGTWVAEAEGKFTGLKNNVIFVRMDPNASEIPSMDAKWNQTEDLVTNAGMTYVIDSWTGGADGKLGGHWQAITIAKGETKAISITNDASVAGTFDGNLVIKHLDKDAVEQTYSLAFSTTVIGLNTWTADFNNTTSTVVYPAGSVAEGGISSDYQYISSGNYNNWLTGRNTSSYATDNNKFITPKLHATAGEKLAFDVKAGYSGTDAYFVKVYVSTDRKTWGEPVETYVYSNTGSSFTTKTITFAEEGDYYVAFALYGTGSGIDNLVGLEKVDVAHDLYIKSVNWPDASVKSGTSLTKPSIDIIPLTDETAEAYTVKYVCGETVLAEGTPVALTASASSTKTFSFSWTPEVVSTTVYENTKVVFDFGGGVTFETDPFTLTVTNEPIFHFVKTIPTSKWSEPTDYTTPITFGKTNNADTQTFYVYNWGSAPLTVKSISVPEGFTVTPTEQFNVVAFDENNLSASSQAITITFSAATPGNYSGNMVITYENDQTFEIAVSGTKLDPTKWYANFGTESNQWPAGSAYQSNISSSNTGTYSAPDYAITSSSTTNNIFVTPKLAATAGEKLMFDAKLYSSYWSEGAVKVYAAATREEVLNAEEGTTRVQLFSVSGEDAENPMTTDYQTFQVPAVEGENYYAFEISGRPYVDEIYGLAPVAVEHDWMVASSNIPADAMQNVASEASVNVLNLGLADEAADSYEVNLYIGGEKTGTAATTPALAMTHQLSAAGTQITVPMQSPKAGTFPVYIEVKAGAYSIATEPVSVTFAEEAPSTGGIQVGTQTSTDRDFGFVDWYNNDGSTTRYTDILYPAAKISAAGIKAGDKITTISFKASNSAKTFKAEVTSWVGTSTGDITYGTPDKTAMQEIVVYSGSVEFPANVESVITLNTPIIWDGTSDIRVYTEAIGQGYGNWMTANYAYDSDMTMSYNGTTKAAPLAYFTLAVEPKTYSGTVKDNSNNPIENATVTLVSVDGDNIQYTGTTNAAGEFSINVVQNTREYNTTASAYGYDDAANNNITFADNVVYNFVLTPEENVSVTVTSAEWATITTPATYAVSFDADTEVYIATSEDGESIKLTKIEDAPAMTPIVIHATAGSYTMTKIASATSDVDDNILLSSDGTQVGDGNGNYYVLGMNSSSVVGFGPLANGVTLAVGKAYIIPASPAGFLTFVIGDEDETTTINAVDAAGMDDDTPIYNLAGQKVGKDYKGVVIVNGKKVVRK